MYNILIYFISIILIAPLIILLLFVFYRISSNIFSGTSSLMRKLPQPPKYPLIGHAGKFDPKFVHLYTHECSTLIGTGINYGIWLLSEPVVVICDPFDMEFILGKGQHNFTKAEAYHQMLDWCIPHGMLITDGDEWKEQRNTFNPSFHFNVIKNTQDHIWEEVQVTSQIIDNHLDDNKDVDISLYMETLTLDVLGKLGFNVNFNAQKDPVWRDAMRNIMFVSAGRAFDPTSIFSMRKQRKQSWKDYYMLNEEIRNVYEHRLKEGIEDTDIDLLAQMQRAEKAGAKWITAYTKGDKWAQYKDQMGLFLFAGSDTTSSLLTSTLYMLAINDKYRKLVQDELDEYIDPVKQPGADECTHLPWLNACIKETLRLRPSVSMVGRRSFQKLQLPSGQWVTPQMNLLCLIYTLHRNNNVWGKDAEKFIPERWLVKDDNGNLLKDDKTGQYQLEVKQPHDNKDIPFNTAYIPFAAGQRTCIGQNLAKLESSLALAILLRRFEFLMPDNWDGKEPRFEAAITMQYSDGLKMKVKRRVDKWKVDESIQY